MNGTTKARLARLEGGARGLVKTGRSDEDERVHLAASAVLAEHLGRDDGCLGVRPPEGAVIALAERVWSGAWTHADGEVLDALRGCVVDPVGYLALQHCVFTSF